MQLSARRREARLAGLTGPLAAAGAVGAVTAYVGAVDPNRAGHYPTCPFLALTGYFCPGCGSLRAIHALAHGDLGAALGLNALTVTGLAVAAVLWVRWVLGRWRGDAGTTPGDAVAPPWALYLVLGVALVFGVVRNLTVGRALAP